MKRNKYISHKTSILCLQICSYLWWMRKYIHVYASVIEYFQWFKCFSPLLKISSLIDSSYSIKKFRLTMNRWNLKSNNVQGRFKKPIPSKNYMISHQFIQFYPSFDPSRSCYFSCQIWIRIPDIHIYILTYMI